MSPKQNGFLHPAMHAKWATYMWPVCYFIELYVPFPSLRVFLNGMISGSFVACCSCLFCNCVHSPFFILSCEFILSAYPPRVQAPKLGEIQMGRLDEEGEGPTVSPSRAASKCGAIPQEISRRNCNSHIAPSCLNATCIDSRLDWFWSESVSFC